MNEYSSCIEAEKCVRAYQLPLELGRGASKFEKSHTSNMATPIFFGVGAIATALVGCHLVKKGVFAGMNAAEQWVKGGFRAKMDRKEAIAILPLN